MTGIFAIFGTVIGSFIYKYYFDGVGGTFFAIMFVAGFGGMGSLIGYVIDLIRKKVKLTREVAPTIEQPIRSVVKNEKPFVYGYGGWLYTFSGLLLVLLYSASTAIYDNYTLINSPEFKQLTTFGFEYYNSLLHPTIILEIIMQSLVIVAVLLISYCFYKLKKILKIVCITLFSILLLFNIVDLFLLLSIQNSYPENILDSTTYDGLIYSFAYFVIWVPYFLFSKRVKNTFIM